MPCISPPQPETHVLLAYLAGEADPETAAHLAVCPACHTRARALAREDRRLVEVLYRGQCPSSDDLVDLVEATLDPLRRTEIERHAAGCAICQRNMADYVAFMALPDAVPALAADTKAVEADAPSRLSELLKDLRVFVATLAGGGGPAVGFAPAWAGAGGASGGLRGSTGEGEGVYAVEREENEDIRISLRVEPDDAERGKRIVSGTLAGLPAGDAADAAVWLAAGDDVVARAAVGARGYFELGGVPAGRYSLTVILPDAAVQIREVEV